MSETLASLDIDSANASLDADKARSTLCISFDSFSTTDALLLESGDYLLLESGDRILL